jgi:two-component system response regulator PilR (NtrC family)
MKENESEGLRRVLVVDDEESMRQMLSILLKKQGIDVVTASRGQEAIDLLESGERFSVVMTDLSMPGGVGGLEVLRAVKSIDNASQVIMITAFATPETAVEAIKSGA